MGLTQGCQPVISFNFGAKNNDRVRKAFKIVLASCFIFTFTLWLVVMLVPQILISAFTSDAQFIEVTKWALRIYMGTTLFSVSKLLVNRHL